MRFLNFILLLSISSFKIYAEDYKFSKEMSLVFIDLIRMEVSEKKNVPLDDIRVLEYLLYARNYLTQKNSVEKKIDKKFGSRKISIDALQKTLTYTSKKYFVELRDRDSHFKWKIKKNKNGAILEGDIPQESILEDYLEEIVNRTYQLISKQKGLGKLLSDEQGKLYETLLSEDDSSTPYIQILDKIQNKNQKNAKNSKWEYIPLKLVAVPVIKGMYEIPQALSSTVTESVTRSPLHNLKGSFAEFKKAFKSLGVNTSEVFQGIKNPRKGSTVEGLLGFTDTAMDVVRGGLGLVKTAVSFVGYPIYRILGGKKSQYVRTKGKRATIITIDTAFFGNFLDKVIDIYGEEIVRGQARGFSQFLCINSTAKENDLKDCILSIPDDIQYVDLFSLTHTGGTDEIDELAEFAIVHKGLKPEIMVSIGCDDSPSVFSHPDETMGQMGTSWAVHYYLSNLIAKRLRGIPVSQSARQAFVEGIPLNVVNPVSLGAFFIIGKDEEKLITGYTGSRPYFEKSRYYSVKDILAKAWKEVVKLESSGGNTKEALILVKEINDYLSANKKVLTRKERRLLRKSLKSFKLHQVGQ